MEKIDLHEFLKISRTVTETGLLETDLPVLGVSIDSRTIRPGELFVAIRGENHDGHRFIYEAAQRGAVAVVADQDGDYLLHDISISKMVVTDTTGFLMELAGWYRSRFRCPVVGITGSTGKTTVKEMLASVLGGEMEIVKTVGNQNNFIGVPLTLFKIASATAAAIVEMGTNHPGEISALARIVQPDVAAITNIGSGHIGFFETRQAIYEEKKALFDEMPGSGKILLNRDDEFLGNYSRDDVRIKTFGLSGDADYRADSLEADEVGRCRFRLNGETEIRLGIPGRHHVRNALLAAGIALELGVSLQTVKSGLEAFQPASQRMEWFYDHDVLFINDAYNSNPESLKAAIDFLCSLPEKKGRQRFLVTGDMLELGKLSDGAHRDIGQYLADKPVDYVYCYGDKSRLIFEALEQNPAFRGTAAWFSQHEEIAQALKEKMTAGDTVLLKGSRGMAMEAVLKYLDIRR